ncbi:hypothetical protein [Mariniblastus fucicola]|uniref:hypothetical protein n=1 Tax=Mariniblastus fucicola TaxID=980251 RepID=UPI00138FD330|nr:hypothetical protein [Mariniblastus fucicola]
MKIPKKAGRKPVALTVFSLRHAIRNTGFNQGIYLTEEHRGRTGVHDSPVVSEFI